MKSKDVPDCFPKALGKIVADRGAKVLLDRSVTTGLLADYSKPTSRERCISLMHRVYEARIIDAIIVASTSEVSTIELAKWKEALARTYLPEETIEQVLCALNVALKGVNEHKAVESLESLDKQENYVSKSIYNILPLKQSTFEDTRDNQTYKIARMRDENLWFVDNLNFNIHGSIEAPATPRYNRHPTYNAKTYGRLYDWSMARRLAPDGWRLPTVTDWKNLFACYDKSPAKLQSDGFCLQYGCIYCNRYIFSNGEPSATFWSSEKKEKAGIFYKLFGEKNPVVPLENIANITVISENYIYENSEVKDWFLSVRYIKES